MLNKELKQLNRIISGMTLVAAGTMLLPILETLDELGKEATKADELELAAIKKLGLEVIGGHVKAPTPELHESLVKVIEEIANKEVAVELPKIDKATFEALAKENSHLNAGDLILVKKFLLT